MPNCNYVLLNGNKCSRLSIEKYCWQHKLSKQNKSHKYHKICKLSQKGGENTYIDKDTILNNELIKMDGLTSATQPVFIITYGPPASGKGSCQDKFFGLGEKNGFDRNNYYSIDVDYLVELLDKDGLVKQKADNYWIFRSAADEIAYKLMKHGMETKKHLVFETTGNKVDLDWYQKEIFSPLKQQGYYIMVTYPLVPVEVLVERAHKRAEKIGRLPTDDYIRMVARNAASNLAKLIKNVDAIIIFDNSTNDKCQYEILNCTNERCNVTCKWSSDYEKCIQYCDKILALIYEKFQVNIDLGDLSFDNKCNV